RDALPTSAAERDRRAKLEGLGGVGDISFGAEVAGFAPNRLEVIVQGLDHAALEQAAERVRAAMAEVPEVTDVTTSHTSNAPRVAGAVVRAAASGHGHTAAATVTSVRQALSAP